MDKERLLKLADHLDKIPDSSFDMAYWFVASTGSRSQCLEEIERQEILARNFSCGMSACVAGHAAFLFPDKLYIRYGDVFAKNFHFFSCVGHLAFAAAFSLCEHDAYRLTRTGMNATAKEKAEEIRKLVSLNPSCCVGE